MEGKDEPCRRCKRNRWKTKAKKSDFALVSIYVCRHCGGQRMVRVKTREHAGGV